jgi:hypothetical protein
MGRFSPRIGISFALLAAFCGAARGQAVTEYGSMTSRSATVANRAHHISDSIGGVWKSLDGKVKGADNTGLQETSPSGTTRRAPVRSRRADTRSARMPRKTYEDPKGIGPGMSYEELVRRFGPPSFGVTTDRGTQTFTYLGRDGGVDLELQDGKVLKVVKPQEIVVVAPK